MGRQTRVSLSPRQVRELRQADFNLVEMLAEAAELAPDRVEVLWLTSLRRTEDENNRDGAKTRVHVVGPPWRAMDISTRRLTGDEEYSAEDQKAANEIARAINLRWIYDPARPGMEEAIARPHGTGPHIHLQAHPSTRRS